MCLQFLAGKSLYACLYAQLLLCCPRDESLDCRFWEQLGLHSWSHSTVAIKEAATKSARASLLHDYIHKPKAERRRRQWHPTLAWQIPWAEEPGRLQSMELLRVGHDWATSFSLSWIGEGNGNPLHCSCLENPRDGGAWWAASYGVTQSRPWLKRLSSSSSSNAERRGKKAHLLASTWNGLNCTLS